MPVLWQHGLGADRKQPAEVFPQVWGVRRITLECRGHGQSELCDPDYISIASFTEDVVALLDHLGVSRAVVGGISLGAGIALRLAVFHPTRVSGLILARPAWIDGPSLETQAPYAEVARLLSELGSEDAEALFAQSQEFRDVMMQSPDNAQSLRSFFTRPNPESTVLLLSRITRDSPSIGGAFQSVRVPTLIIANDQEFVHPIGYARSLANLLPSASLKVITSKTINRRAYVDEFRHALGTFLIDLEAAQWKTF
jgi:pimeloyl-ACP methyl ester carboxylesterase